MFFEVISEVFWELVAFFTDPQQLASLMLKLLIIVIIFIIARIAIRIINSLISRFIDSQKNLKFKVDVPRLETMKGLLMSIVKYTIYFIAFTTVLRSFGTDVTALITAAGIGGVALGFGAQNLVRDIITGFFILFEDQFGVGSYIEIDGVSGIVEDMALRVTKVRGFNGDLFIIPNGEIKKVINRSNGKMRALVEISIAYEEDIDNAIAVLMEASEKLQQEDERILEGPTVLGVSDLADSEVIISVMAKTVPMEQWAVERLMRKTFKEAFDQKGIEIPYPRRVVINQNS